MQVVIAGFTNRTTQDLFDGADTKEARKIPEEIWTVARRKLDMINAATSVSDLRAPPGNRLEQLKGDRAGQHSVRINDQYRICFVFENGNARNVEITDYH